MAILCISLISTAQSDSYSVSIGDVLDSSSALLIVNSPAVATATFEAHTETIIFQTSEMPLKITENCPLRSFSLSSEQLDNAHRGNLNYLRGDEPIYLLSGSSIQYRISSSFTGRVGSQQLGCLYLFSSDNNFEDFINTNLIVYEKKFCFNGLAVSNVESYTFNITKDGLYYVGIDLQTGVAIKVNVSVVRVYYNITGLQPVCNIPQLSCSINLCHTFICTHKGTTYFLMKPSNNTEINYSFTSPKLHGSTYSGFIATVVLGTLCCCCCYCLFCRLVMNAFSCCDDFDCVDIICDCCENYPRRRKRFKRLIADDSDDENVENDTQAANSAVSQCILPSQRMLAPSDQPQIQEQPNHGECIPDDRNQDNSLLLFEHEMKLAIEASKMDTQPFQWEGNSNAHINALPPAEETDPSINLEVHLPVGSNDFPLIDFTSDEPCLFESHENPPPSSYEQGRIAKHLVDAG